MIRINQIKMPLKHTEQDLKLKAAKLLHVFPEQIIEMKIKKQSLDARKKSEILYIYVVDISLKEEELVLQKIKSPDILLKEDEAYIFPEMGSQSLSVPPVIVGSGPAGLFCGLLLAQHGYRPIIIERGESVEDRNRSVDEFWKTGKLNENSNVQFGEGGAGTFSDGKLNTMVKDPFFRNRKVMELFVEAGADESILYLNKPHIGTDVLRNVVRNMRKQIQEHGGEVRFNSQMTNLMIRDGSIIGLEINGIEQLKTDTIIMAIGHSARDTFQMLHKHPVEMSQKAFAVGLRIQHPQKMIQLSQYGTESKEFLPTADYKLTKQTKGGRGVYSFCMCPGGYVVNSSSELGHLAVNGMSYQDRSGVNANSALIVTVTPEDFGDSHPLSGILFQQKLEAAAYHTANGAIPIQLYEDFCKNQDSKKLGEVAPELKGDYQLSNLREILPEVLNQALMEGIESFEQKIRGFSKPDCLLAGVESRTSSPIRIERNQEFESNIKGLFPCGEGAGYAGGITSAAMDGIKIAEEIAKRYKKLS